MRRARTRLKERIARKVDHRLSANREEERGILFWLGMFGLVGWSVAVPTLLGTAFGIWLDSRFSTDISWTLTGLLTGVVLGCINAWYWIKEEDHD